MSMNPALTMKNERAACARLRDTILQVGRQIGWPSRTAITFTEQCARRPWKRCTSGQLWTVLEELDAVRSAGQSPHPEATGVGDQRHSRSPQQVRHADLD